MPKQKQPHLSETFRAVLPADRRAEHKKLFGNPCCFVNGTMFTSVHEGALIVRLSPTARARLLKMEGAAVFEPLRGRPMTEYVRVPAAMLEDPASLRDWVQRAFDYCAKLPRARKKA